MAGAIDAPLHMAAVWLEIKPACGPARGAGAKRFAAGDLSSGCYNKCFFRERKSCKTSNPNCAAPDHTLREPPLLFIVSPGARDTA